mgnify:CR=1 FL=1
MVNMRQALGVDDFNQMSNYTGQLQNQRRAVGQKQYGLGGKVLNMAAALGDAYNQYQPPETALGMMALPAKAVYGLGNMIVQDVGDKTKSIMGTDRSNPAAMDQAATDALGLAADTMAGGGVVSRMTDMPKGAILGANVFQGGPHKYGPEGAAESLKHMSKGEGVQAYGYGRYDAESKDVAQDYKNTLGNKVKQEVVTPEGRKDAIDFAVETLTKGISGDKLKSAEQTIRAIYGSMNVTQIKDAMTKSVIPTARGQRGLEKDKWADFSFDETTEAYLYKHDLPDDDIARYLDYDAPLSEQPESVRKALGYGNGNIKKTEVDEVITFSDGVNSVTVPKKPSGTNLNYFPMKGSGPLSNMQPLTRSAISHEQAEKVARQWLEGTTTTGDQLLHKTGKNQAASEALAKAGIPGLKYFDGMSRPASSTKSLIEAAGSQEAALANARKRFDSADADWGPMADDHKKRWADAIRELEKPQTRNFVTWDQDVLNRMKLLERNGESMVDALSGVNNK